MKALGLALIAALAIGCSSTPTSPSTSLVPAAVVADQAARPPHIPDTQKVTIYFYGTDFGRNVLTNLSVHVWSASVTERLLYTDKQHSVSIDVPKTDTWVGYRIDADHWSGICATQGVLPLPIRGTENWILVSRCSAAE